MLRDEVLATIINAENVLIAPDTIGEIIQCPSEVIRDCLVDLEVDGIISTWEMDGNLSVTLTPLGAERLSVQVVEWGDKGNCRWSHIGKPLPPPPKAKRNNNRAIEYIIDPSLSPDIQAEMSEDVGVLSAMPAEKRKSLPKTDWQGIQRFDDFSLPYPTVLLGGGIAFWDNVQHQICPGCSNRELRAYEYCLLCDRWGMDKFMKDKNLKLRVQVFVERQTGVTINLTTRKTLCVRQSEPRKNRRSIRKTGR